MERVSCALCRVDETTPYAEENGYHAVRCARCGLIYVNPRPTIDEMKALYDGLETKIDIGAHIRRRDVKIAQAQCSLRTIRREKRRGRLLEVGSAAGYLLFEAKKLGYDVQGIDITHQLVLFSRNVLGVPTHEGTLRNAPFREGSFDVVYMRNVLSHLAYPEREYTLIRSLLRPGGVLIFETGNVAELTPKVAGELELPDHLYLFGESTIRRLLELTGFSCRSVARYGLLEHLGPVRALAERLASSQARDSAPSLAAAAPAPSSLPRSTRLGRLEGAVGTRIRYGLGRLLPQRARRCSLVVVAERA